jgi:hypothetical protein
MGFACRVDVTQSMTADALVGRHVRVLWPDDRAWFLGTVIGHDPEHGSHEVPC